MTTIRPTSISLIDPHDVSIGKEKSPVVPNDVPPNPAGNNSLPPRTNLSGPPSAFQDLVTSSGGGPIIVPGEPRNGLDMRPPKWILFKDWVGRNSTPLIVICVAVFVALSVR